jgi:hypothetical protein
MKATRRRILQGGAAALALSVLKARAQNAPLTLWYRQPATQWTVALSLGNGRMAPRPRRPAAVRCRSNVRFGSKAVIRRIEPVVRKLEAAVRAASLCNGLRGWRFCLQFADEFDQSSEARRYAADCRIFCDGTGQGHSRLTPEWRARLPPIFRLLGLIGECKFDLNAIWITRSPLEWNTAQNLLRCPAVTEFPEFPLS